MLVTTFRSTALFLFVVAVLRTCLVFVITLFVVHSTHRALQEECSPVLSMAQSVQRQVNKELT